MLFYLGSSLASAVRQNDSETIDFLRRILDSRKRGLLLIHSSVKTLDALIEFFSRSNSLTEISILKFLRNRHKEKKQIIRELTRFVYVSTYARIKTIRKGIITISPKLANHTNILYPPIFLGENLDDCKFYAYAIADNFKEQLPISITSLSVHKGRFIGGGGNTTHDQYLEEKVKKIDLCFCIVDSDRKCKEEDYGDTAKFVQNVDLNSKSPFCDYLIIDTYSAENLLPIRAIRDQFIIGKSRKQISEFDLIARIRNEKSWPFLPLKKGLSGKDLKKGKAYSKFWTSEMLNLGKTLPCCADDDCSCVFLPSIGTNTLEKAIQDKSKWLSDLNDESNSEIKDMYLKISIEVRSWFCVGNAIRS